MLTHLFVSLLAVAALAQEAQPDPRENLETAIPEAIRLIEAKEILTFIKQFAHPDDLKKLAESGKTADKLAEQFSGNKAERLVRSLKAVKDKKPELNEDGTQALFKVDDKDSPGGKLVFQKSGKLWYIRN